MSARQVEPAGPVKPGGLRPGGDGVGALDWLGLALICACSAFSAVLELLFVPLYIGSVIIPVVVVAAIVANIVLPTWGFRTVGRALGAIVPMVVWLVVVLGLSMVPRPEGDLFVLGAYNQQWNFYGLLLLGAIAGFTTILRVTTPQPRPDPSRPTPTGSARSKLSR